MVRMKTIAAFLAFVSSGGCFAAPDKVAYELQERCGRQAAAEFKREFGNVGIPSKQGGTTNLYNFQNHYNSKLNACVYLLRANGFESARNKKRGDISGAYESLNLFDLNENKELGSYFMFLDGAKPMVCQVHGKPCGSKEEWESLVKPFLEE
jgi:hypothetical protein